MKILITGGTGLVGTKLVKKLQENGHQVHLLVRKKSTKSNTFYWNISKNEIDENAFDGIDSIIHLAGASIGQRWTKTHQKAIYDSRINTAKFLLDKCKKLNINLKNFISASGINYYGTFTSDKIFTEETPILHQDFLADVCKKWENAAWQFSPIAERIVILRTAPVFAKKGGCLDNIKTITDLHASSGLGNGKQWFNWIHLEDLVNLYLFALENTAINGAINAVADDIPTHKHLMKRIAKMRKKLFIPVNVPSFILKLVLGKMSEMLLEGTRISNQKIKDLGFSFKYKNLQSALENVI